MFSQIKGLTSTYTPNRGTLAKVRNSPYTATAVKVVSATTSATAQVASVTVVPATIAGASYLQQQLDPHGRYDAQVDQLITAAGHGIVVLASSKAITAVKEALTPDLTHPSVTGHIATPCDVERVEMFDADDLLAFPVRQSNILSTYSSASRKASSPYIASDDGIEEGMEDISLYTTKEVEVKKDGRMVVKDGLAGDGWELVEKEDQCDSETEEFQLERLADSLAQDGCGEFREAEIICGERMEEGYRRGVEDSSQLGLDEEEQMSQSRIEEKEDDERLFGETKWIKHEQTRAESGEETRALGDMLDNGNFLPSSKFMLADMGAGRRDREEMVEKERKKYEKSGEDEEKTAEEQDITAGHDDVAAGEEGITRGNDEITHEEEAEAIPVSDLLEEYELDAQMEANSFAFPASAEEVTSLATVPSLPISGPEHAFES